MFRITVLVMIALAIVGMGVGVGFISPVDNGKEECIFFPPTIDQKSGLPIPAFEKCPTPRCELPFVCYDGYCRHIDCGKFGCYPAFECIGP